jgi:hypothetical protein
MPELGGSQISALLEAVPGIASVLRSPVADALVNMIRAGAGIRDFAVEDARELVQYAVRRGLISADEGDHVLADVAEAMRARRSRARAAKRAKKGGPAKRPAGKTAARTRKKRAAAAVRRSSGPAARRSKRR